MLCIYRQGCPDINMQIVPINGMTSFKICDTYTMHRHKPHVLELPLICASCTSHRLTYQKAFQFLLQQKGKLEGNESAECFVAF